MRGSVKLLIGLCVVATSQTFAQGKFSGLVYSDYYWVAKNHDEEIEGRNGLWFRRIYLTYEQNLSEEFDMRVRLEMNSAGNFTSNSKLNPFIKDVYLRWKRGNHSFYIGQSTSPTWGFIEQAWGYRHLEKTVLDLQKFASSRDVGFAAKGKLGQAGRVHYHFMLGNGNSTGTETNKGKKLMLALGYKLTDNLTLEGYVDWDDRPGDQDRYTYQGFLSYEKGLFRAGAQVLNQTRKSGTGADDLNLAVASFFTVFPLASQTKGIVRLDRLFDPNPDGDSISYLPFSSAAKSTFLLLGVDYELAPTVHFIPNIELVVYDSANGADPDADVVPRLTFFYNWSNPVGK